MTHSGHLPETPRRPLIERMEPRTLFSGGWGGGGAVFEPRGDGGRLALIVRAAAASMTTTTPVPATAFSFFAFARPPLVGAGVADPVLKPMSTSTTTIRPPAWDATEFGGKAGGVTTGSAWHQPAVGWAAPPSQRSGDVLIGSAATKIDPGVTQVDPALTKFDTDWAKSDAGGWAGVRPDGVKFGGVGFGGGGDKADGPGRSFDFAWTGQSGHFEFAPGPANVVVVVGVRLPVGGAISVTAGDGAGTPPASAGGDHKPGSAPSQPANAPPSGRPSLGQVVVVGTPQAGAPQTTGGDDGKPAGTTANAPAARPQLTAVAARDAAPAAAGRPAESASTLVAAAGDRPSASPATNLAGRDARPAVASAATPPVPTVVASADDPAAAASASAFFLRASTAATGLVLRAAPAAATEFVEWSGTSSPFWSGTIGSFAGDAVGGEVPGSFGAAVLGLAPWAGPAAADLHLDGWAWKLTAAASFAVAYAGYVYCKAAAACRAQDEREKRAAAKATEPVPSNGRAKYVRSRVLA